MAVQTAYNDRIATAYNGMVADQRLTEIISREVEDATLAIGRAVIQGTADDQVKVGAAGVYIGVTVKDVTLPPESGDVYQEGNTAAIITRGAIWVTVGGDVAAGAAVYRDATGVLSATSTDNTLVDNAMWGTTASNGNLALLILK